MTPKQSMRVGIYVRISVDRDGLSESPERQLKACRQVAEMREWTVVDEYIDKDTSAYSNRPRPQYKRLIDDVRSGRINCILFWKLDRIARRLSTIQELLTLYRDTNCVLHSATESIDTSEPIGQGWLSMLGAMAEQESANTSRRVKAAMKSRIERGEMPTGGYRCFGYEQGTGKVVTAEAKELRRMVTSYLGGSNFRQIAKDLNVRGVTTTQGGQWTSKTVGQLLKSPRIGGYRPSPDGTALVRGKWTPIIKPEVFTQLREALDTSRTPKARANEATHLLTGFARCGKCGGRLSATKWKQPHAGGRPINRLQCLPDVGRSACGGVSVTEHSLEKVIVRELHHSIIGKNVGMNRNGKKTAALRKELASLEAKQQELVDDYYLHGRVTKQAFDATRRKLEDRIGELRTMLDDVPDVGVIAPFKAMKVKDIEAWWSAQPLSAQRALIRRSIEFIEVRPAQRRGGNVFDPSRVTIHWRSGFEDADQAEPAEVSA